MDGPKLPDLESLKYFESAARLGSYTKAATELFVTQAAVSQQIRNLEERLGVKLFQRRGRTMVLTDVGESIVGDVTEGLDILQTAMRRLARHQQPNALTITMMPSFASRWLIPRLWKFSSAHPDVELRLNPTSDVVDLSHSDMDLAVRLGDGNYPGLTAQWLMDDCAYAVACPKIAEQIKEPSDVTKFLLVHGWVKSGMNWSRWFAKAGVKIGRKRLKQTVVNDGGLTVDMLLSGHGIGVTRHTLVKDLIESGQLVKLFDVAIPGEYQYYMVHRSELDNNPVLNQFKQWLKQQAEDFEANCTILEKTK